MRKRGVDLIFIVVFAGVLLLINQLEYQKTFMAFSLIPLLGAYFLGQFSERRFGHKEEGK